MNRYTIPVHLDDPELIGFWTLDEFLAMVLPFIWGVPLQPHPIDLRGHLFRANYLPCKGIYPAILRI